MRNPQRRHGCKGRAQRTWKAEQPSKQRSDQTAKTGQVQVFHRAHQTLWDYFPCCIATLADDAKGGATEGASVEVLTSKSNQLRNSLGFPQSQVHEQRFYRLLCHSRLANLSGCLIHHAFRFWLGQRRTRSSWNLIICSLCG
jgi:hypothetical protein